MSVLNVFVIYVLRGWYAFDWKAFLFHNKFDKQFSVPVRICIVVYSTEDKQINNVSV